MLIFFAVLLFAFVVVGIHVIKLGKASLPISQTLQVPAPGSAPQIKTAFPPPVEASEVNSVSSPDGKFMLVMKKTKNGNEVDYSFTVSGRVIFERTVDSSVSFSIPANTWSPDNKYVFLKETDATNINFFVLSAAKDPSLQNDQTANISGLFSKKYPDLTIGDVTGWGGINLVIVNSEKSVGVRGPSFWYYAPSPSFTQLSTRF